MVAQIFPGTVQQSRFYREYAPISTEVQNILYCVNTYYFPSTFHLLSRALLLKLTADKLVKKIRRTVSPRKPSLLIPPP